MTPAGFAHSEIRGSSGHVPLTAAYRSLSRPSSASCAKASTVCPYHLLFLVRWLEHTSSRAGSPRRVFRCDLLEENLSSRYAALKVRRGSPPGTGHCAPCGAAKTASAGLTGRPSMKVSSSKKLVLPRKEVIQPHLPVRLPCYDFTPLTNHTFGASLTRLGRRLRVQSTRVV